MSFVYERPIRPANLTFGGGEAPFSELWASSRELAMYADNFNADEKALEEAYDRRIDAINSAIGVSVKNPMRQPTAAPRAAGVSVGQIKTREQWMADFDRHISLLIRQHPEARDAISPGMPVIEEAKQLAREAEARFGRAASSRQDFFGKWSAMIGGGMAGGLRDPVQVATLMAGGGPGAARSVAGRILTVAVKEMVINGAVEAAMQPKVQAWREKAGLEAGFVEAARNTVFAAAAGGLFGLGGQMVAEAGRAVFKGRLLDSASALAAAGLDLASPLAKSLKGAPVDSPGDLVAIREALPPEARGALDARAADATIGPAPDEARQAEALRFAEDPQEGRISFDDVRGELTAEMGSRPTGRQPQSLLAFLASEGGLRADGDLSARNAERWFGQGGRLVRKDGGMSLDEARRKAVAAGYLDDTPFDGGVSTSTVDDLLAAIDDELAGQKVYSRKDGDAGELTRAQRAFDDNLAMIERTLAELQGVTTDDMPIEIKRRAADLMIRGDADAETALERAIMEDYYGGEPERALAYDDGQEIPFAPDDRPGGAQQRGDAASAVGGADGAGERGFASDGAEPGSLGEAQGRPAAVDERLIVNPIDPALSAEAKIAALNKLTEENAPIIKDLIGRIDARFGTKSKANVKEPGRIAEKAKRPSILATKPWHDVEHIRDSYRFKTILGDLSDLAAIIKMVTDDGIEIVKVDLEKVLRPKEWGFRIAALDLRMRNGQLFEYYLPVREIEAVKGSMHKVFERWRNRDISEFTEEDWAEYARDIDLSYETYRAAFNAYLDRTGQDETAVRAALESVARSTAPSTGPKSFMYSSADTPPRAQVPFGERTAAKPSRPNTAMRPSGAMETRSVISDTDNPSELGRQDAPYGEPAGGVDDPTSAEEAALTDAMLKELDPDGSLAESFGPAAELKSDADELSELATFLTHCKVGDA